MKLRNLLICTIIVMFATSSMTVNAMEQPYRESMDVEVVNLNIPPMARYVDVSNMKASFSISGTGKASVFGNLFARTAEKTRVRCEIKRYINSSWQTYKSWEVTEDTHYATVLLDYYVPKGYSYKLYVYGYAWVDGVIVDRPFIRTQTEYY